MKTLIITLVIASVAVTVGTIKMTQVPVTNPASENVKSDTRAKGENKNGLGNIGFIFGQLGFIYGLAALGQISKLKKEVEKLKSQIDPKN
jgi:NADPH:quinone reductase-like Zn-dependent oxidoreductase